MTLDIDPDAMIEDLLGYDTSMKIDHSPMKSCYQVISDSPQMDTDTSRRRRRRRDVHDVFDDDFGEENMHAFLHSRKKRQTTTYNYDAFCTNVLEGSSSTLAT